MRDDFDKILVERPRKGGVGKKEIRKNRHETRRNCKTIAQGEDAEIDNVSSMKRLHTNTPHSWDNRKSLNENLQPLRRFLRSKVGKPWNDVYSEIMSKLNLNNSVQYHVWQHLIKFGEVATKTYREGNKIMVAENPPREVGLYGYRGMGEFYVDPDKGTLEIAKVDKIKYESVKLNKFIHPCNNLIQYFRIEGIWYEIILREPTEKELEARRFFYSKNKFDTLSAYAVINSYVSNNKIASDIAHSNLNYYPSDLWNLCKRLFDGHYLPIGKRQLASREIKRLRLSN